MMSRLHRGLVLVACVSAGFVISAGPNLVARAAEPDRWVGAIKADASTTAAPDSGARARIAELEQRIKELEAERRAQQVARRAPELAAVLARNEELAARNEALALENRELAQSRAFERSDQASAAWPPPNPADARAQLRYWARQLRDGKTTARKLSPELNAAINVLVRTERQLDPQNPWRERQLDPQNPWREP